MKDTGKKELLMGIALLVAFALWTILIRHIDVQMAGPNGTEIGFATFNVWFHLVCLILLYKHCRILSRQPGAQQ